MSSVRFYLCYLLDVCPRAFFFFFFNDTATTEIYTLSLHDALPIWRSRAHMSKVSNPSAEVSSESGAMSTPAAKAAYVRDAVEILRVPGGDAKRILKVAKELNKHDEFGYAWRILAKALTLPGIQNEPEYVEIVQRTAL